MNIIDETKKVLKTLRDFAERRPNWRLSHAAEHLTGGLAEELIQELLSNLVKSGVLTTDGWNEYPEGSVFGAGHWDYKSHHPRVSATTRMVGIDRWKMSLRIDELELTHLSSFKNQV